MLQLIRDRATGWIAWVIVIFISIPFALWGIQEYLGARASVAVAEVNGEEVSYQRYQRALQRQVAQMRRFLGASFDASFDESAMRDQVIEQMVQEESLVQAGAAAGMRVGDAELAGAIQTQPTFQQEGRFSQPLYENFLRSQGYSPGGFEFELRRNLLSEQLTSGLSSSEIATPSELRDIDQMRLEKRTYRQLEIASERLKQPVTDEDAISKHFEENKDTFVTPEKVSVSYIEISRDEIANSISTNEDDLRTLYEAQASNYLTPEQREASHILLDVPADADDDAVAKVRDEIDALYQQLVDGADFAELAKEHSKDPGSSNNGGSLGFFGRGVMDPKFEEAAFALAEGELSEPVRSSFGFHLIKVTTIDEERTRSFDEVRDELLRSYQEEEAGEIFFDRAERLAELAFEHPDSLDQAAEELGIELTESGLFANGSFNEEEVDSILNHPSVQQAAFSTDVLQDRNNSELLELDDGRVVVLRVTEHEESTPRTLDDVRSEIAETLSEEAANESARMLGEHFVAKLAAGESIDDLLEAHGLAWSEPQEATRNNAGALSGQNLQRLYKMVPAEDSGASFSGAEVASGYNVLALDSIVAGESEEDEAKSEAARSQLVGAFGRAQIGAFTDHVRKAANVEVYEAVISSQ